MGSPLGVERPASPAAPACRVTCFREPPGHGLERAVLQGPVHPRDTPAVPRTALPKGNSAPSEGARPTCALHSERCPIQQREPCLASFPRAAMPLCAPSAERERVASPQARLWFRQASCGLSSRPARSSAALPLRPRLTTVRSDEHWSAVRAACPGPRRTPRACLTPSRALQRPPGRAPRGQGPPAGLLPLGWPCSSKAALGSADPWGWMPRQALPSSRPPRPLRQAPPPPLRGLPLGTRSRQGPPGSSGGPHPPSLAPLEALCLQQARQAQGRASGACPARSGTSWHRVRAFAHLPLTGHACAHARSAQARPHTLWQPPTDRPESLPCGSQRVPRRCRWLEACGSGKLSSAAASFAGESAAALDRCQSRRGELAAADRRLAAFC